MTSSDEEDDASGLIATLQSLPLAKDSFSAIRRRYKHVKGSHALVTGTFNSIESSLEAISALPLVRPSVHVMDKLACHGLKRIRKSCPALRTMSSQDLQMATKNYYYKHGLLYRNFFNTALHITKNCSLQRLNEASMEVGRNIGDAVVVSKSAFVNGVCLTMDAVTKTMNFFEFVVDRYFNTEAPVARVRAGRKPTVIPSSRRRLTFSLDHEEEKYEDRDETCKERFGKMQRKISVCIKRQPKSLTTHFVHQACDDFKLLMAYFFCTLYSCLQLLKYPVIQALGLLSGILTATFLFTLTMTWKACEQVILRSIKLWTLVLAVTCRQVNKSSRTLPSPIRTSVQSTATYFEHLHENLADTHNLNDMRVELTAEREEIRKMASAAISKVRRWTTNG